MNQHNLPVLTVGHSTHPLELFLALVKKHGVTAIADVRSDPFSRYQPQFNREGLERSLKAAGIEYVFLGEELGARSRDPDCYVAGQVQFSRLAATEPFKRGIERIIQGAERYLIAIMCAEKEPLECHRTLLVARALWEKGVEVRHILADGSIETNEHALERLLDLTGLPHEDLFRSHEELIAAALAGQEKKIAYVDKRPAAAGREERREALHHRIH